MTPHKASGKTCSLTPYMWMWVCLVFPSVDLAIEPWASKAMHKLRRKHWLSVCQYITGYSRLTAYGKQWWPFLLLWDAECERVLCTSSTQQSPQWPVWGVWALLWCSQPRGTPSSRSASFRFLQILGWRGANTVTSAITLRLWLRFNYNHIVCVQRVVTDTGIV